MKKAKRKPQLRPRPYEHLCATVEAGVKYGLFRAYKYSDVSPDDDELSRIGAEVEQAVLNAMCEAFEF